MKKNVTLESLSEQMTKQMSELKSELTGKIDSVNAEVKPLHTEVKSLNTQVKSLHTEVNSIHTEVNSLHAEVKSLAFTLVAIDYKTDKIFEILQENTTSVENKLARRVDNLEDSMRVVKTKLQIQ
jgi:chromosome segregation ATPase